MKIQSIILSLIYILSSTQVLAQENEQSVKEVTVEQNTTKTQKRSLGPRSLRKSSYENRMDKSATIAVGIGYEMLEFGQFLNADIFLDADTLISLRASYADDKYDRYNDDSYIYRDRDTQFTTSVQLKQFVSNSFYLKAGIFYRDLKEEKTRPSLFSSDTGTYRLKDMGLTFSLGNQWNFSKFTLGCDWFGITNSMKKLSESGNPDYFNINDDRVSINLITFYAGMTF
jgi:hypothetical protein